MTTYLQTLDRRNNGKISFDHFCHDTPITYDRSAFWEFVRRDCGILGDLTWQNWDRLWETFMDWQDARDLHQTQADALR